MTIESTYPVVFASPRRDSAIPATTSARGDVAWKTTIGLTMPRPPAVLTSTGHVVLVAEANFALFGPGGKRLWTREKQSGTPVVVAGGLFYYKSRKLFLEAVDADNGPVLQRSPFPWAMAPETQVGLLWPRENDFVAAAYWPGDDEVAEGDAPDTPLQPPQVTGLRNRYGTTYGDWGTTVEGRPKLPPLFAPDLNRMALAVDEAIRLDIGEERELSRFKLPLEQVTDWSVDSREIYALAGYEAGKKVLLSLSSEGAELWRWTDAENADRWSGGQPPIRAGKRRVYALTEKRVLAVEKGRLLWQHDAEDGTVRRGSSLEDGSVLVTAGKNLLHLNAKGRLLFSVDVGDEILSPPVVDAQGSIYVATASELVQIR
jgi:hypothetical protein